MTQGHGHHHRQCQSHAHLHLRLAADEVAFKPKLWSIQGAAALVTALPGGTAMGCRGEDAPVLLGKLDPHDASVLAGVDLPILVALGLSFTLQTVGSSGAAVFEGVAIGLEYLEGQVSSLSSPRSALTSRQRVASSGVSSISSWIIARSSTCSEWEAGVRWIT